MNDGKRVSPGVSQETCDHRDAELQYVCEQCGARWAPPMTDRRERIYPLQAFLEGRDMSHFWYSWPSWLVELLSGFAVSTGCWWLLRWTGVWEQLAVSLALSLAYELVLDVNGWSVKDVAQREVGIVLGTLLWLMLGRI